MIKEAAFWTVDQLEKQFPAINFPEYQREPNIWSRSAKQRLIDSILRQFDISSVYFYEEEESIDCIDGRQRIGAIMSFLGQNEEDKEDNGFPVRMSNEIYRDDEPPFEQYNGKTYAELKALAATDGGAQELIDRFLGYKITIVQLSGAERSQEFNLQFTRLNLGMIINAGEKLHAMFGEMRDICFERMVGNPFLEKINIPTRRYARQQVAAQILAQIFHKKAHDEWSRARHYDLQIFFKDNGTLDDERRTLVARVEVIMNMLAEAFDDFSVLRNRAISVSTVLLAWEAGISTPEEAKAIATFVQDFVCRLHWQVGRMTSGLGVHEEYRYLIEFQRHVTQASVEKYAVQGRAESLESRFELWKETGRIEGDQEYLGRDLGDPADTCRGL